MNLFTNSLSDNMGLILFSITIFTLIDSTLNMWYNRCIDSNNNLNIHFKVWLKKNLWIISIFTTPILYSLYIVLLDYLIIKG